MMNQEYERTVGQRIRLIRLERRLSQDQLAAKLQVYGWDITRSALAKIEVGQRHLYVDELKALHEVLKISYEELLE